MEVWSWRDPVIYFLSSYGISKYIQDTVASNMGRVWTVCDFWTLALRRLNPQRWVRGLILILIRTRVCALLRSETRAGVHVIKWIWIWTAHGFFEHAASVHSPNYFLCCHILIISRALTRKMPYSSHLACLYSSNLRAVANKATWIGGSIERKITWMHQWKVSIWAVCLESMAASLTLSFANELL